MQQNTSGNSSYLNDVEYVRKVALAMGIKSLDEINSEFRDAYRIARRRELCLYLREQNWSCPRIARSLQLGYGTIVDAVRGSSRGDLRRKDVLVSECQVKANRERPMYDDGDE